MTERRQEGWDVIAWQISRERRAFSRSLARAVLISRRTAFLYSRGVLGGGAAIDVAAGGRGRGVARTGIGTGGTGFGFGFLTPALAGAAGAALATLAAFEGPDVLAGLAAAFFAEAADALAGAFFGGDFMAKGIAGRAVFLGDGDFRGGITTNLSAASRALASLPVPGCGFRG